MLFCPEVEDTLRFGDKEEAEVCGRSLRTGDFALTESNFSSKSPSFPWIASSAERGKEPRAAWVAFPVTLVRGFVTVQYLETYEDAGAFELWIGSTPGSNHDVEGVVPQPAHNSDRSAYKSESTIRGAPVSYFNTRSVFVDTWAKNRTTSELKLRTFDFAAHGEHLLHLRQGATWALARSHSLR